MIRVRSPADIEGISHPVIKAMVAASMRKVVGDFPDSYAPATHGWYLVCESPEDLDSPAPFHKNLSLCAWLLSWPVEQVTVSGDVVELVLVVSDSEAVAALMPLAFLSDSQRQTLLGAAEAG
jgi:hypothetical protein